VTSSTSLQQGDQPDRLPLMHEAVLRLSSLVHILRMYPRGHPRIEAASAACLEVLQKVFSHRPALLLLVHFDRLLCEDGVLSETDPIAESFVPELRKRGVRMILVRRGVARQDVTDLAEIIAMKPEELESRGGARQILLDRGVSSVELLDFKYSMDGREVVGEIEDPMKAIESVHRLLAYRIVFEELLQKAGLPPGDMPALRKALTDQSVLERSLALDGSLPADWLADSLTGLSLRVAESLVSLMKASKVRFSAVGPQTLGNTINWVMDTTTDTVRLATAEQGAQPILEDIARGIFSTPGRFASFLKKRAAASQDIDPTTADLLKWIFGHVPSAQSMTPQVTQPTEHRDAPTHPPLHAVLKQLEDLSNTVGSDEPIVEETDISRSAVAAFWYLLAREDDVEASKSLGARLAHVIEELPPTERDNLIWRLLKATTNKDAETVSTPALVGWREALDSFETAELVNSVLAGDAEEPEKTAILKGFVDAKPQAVSAMVDYYFCSLDDTGKDSLVTAIAAAPSYAVVALREQFEKCDPSSLRDLGQFLNALKHESAVNLLEELSHHENASVARAALGALAENSTPAAALALTRNFMTADKQTRKAIILLLAGVNQVASLQTLLRVAHMRDFLNRRLDERIMAIQALGRLGDEQAEPTLNALARTRGLFRRRTAAKLRQVATRALARLHGETDTYTVAEKPPHQG